MPAIVRKDDPHACGAVAVGHSPDTFVNNLGVHRVTDAESGDHGSVQDEGSPDTFVNNLAVARIELDRRTVCPIPIPPHPPDVHTSGSPDTFVN